MTNIGYKKYPIDNSAILYLAQMRKNHSNVYRFCATMTEPVCPELLQKAADNVFARFPAIMAAVKPAFFSCYVIPSARAPRVQADTGLLRTMSAEEMKSCGYRICYDGMQISIEAFHGLTDGYGAIQSFRTLLAEYLCLRYGISLPEKQEMLEGEEPDWQEELRDAYLDHGIARPTGIPGRYAYQLPGKDRSWQVKTYQEQFSTAELLQASRNCGVSLTAMLSTIMAEAIAEIQQRQNGGKILQPVRIMVPVDLRKLFPSKTLRNYILYALPTVEAVDCSLPRRERFRRIQEQLRSQVSRERLTAQISRNVRAQRSWLFRMIPLAVKCTAMRIAYRFWGENNSSITLTNLGPISLSTQMKSYVERIDVHLTPRRGSPYNCGLVSCGDVTSISITRFGAEPELEPLFFGKLRTVLQR